MIKIKNLNKFYQNNHILNNINMEIDKGEVITVIGPSGSGKSTLLRCINYLEEPDSGEIFLNNQLISAKNANLMRTKIGMVFQNFNLFPHMTALENITYAPINVLNQPKEIAYKKAREIMDLVGLSNKINEHCCSLSGGQKQRVAIARALAMSPEIILFDEPTSALDPEMTFEILKIIKSIINQDLTVIIVTHDVHFAKNVSNRVIFLDHGKIIEDSNTGQFFQKPKSIRAKEFLKKII